MEPQHTQPTLTQPMPTLTSLITTSGPPIESGIEIPSTSLDASRSAQANLSYPPYDEPAPPYSAVPVYETVRIEPVPQVAKVTPLHLLGEQPAWIDCPFCQRRAMTRVLHGDSAATWYDLSTLSSYDESFANDIRSCVSILCCLICICLACIPSTTGMCQNTSHFCSNCGKQVSHKPHNGATQPLKPMYTLTVNARRPLAENSTIQS
ncbi:LITAF-like zinc finger domain-containing protein [Penicillium malachiteum]|uniref:LITAF-like zinc finger domain-containing protein n=1 Tax=Penicillium malachiteum TaxID=1324776 RepID=A0AAD6HDR6_9EURO|nr:LITAF-like zinc finger domain-containing protein [Penicillium malachiteum]